MRRSAPSIHIVDVVLVDDHALLIEVLCASLRSAGLTVHPIVAIDPASAAADLGRVEARVAVFDLVLGEHTSLPLIQRATSAGVAVIALTGVSSADLLFEALEAGARAAISKSEPFENLLHAIRCALEGEPIAVTNTMTIRAAARREHERRRASMAPFGALTPREQETLSALMHGLVAAEIADHTELSLETVRSHIKALLRKLGVHTQLAAVAAAHAVGWPHHDRGSTFTNTSHQAKERIP